MLKKYSCTVVKNASNLQVGDIENIDINDIKDLINKTRTDYEYIELNINIVELYELIQNLNVKKSSIEYVKRTIEDIKNDVTTTKEELKYYLTRDIKPAFWINLNNFKIEFEW